MKERNAATFSSFEDLFSFYEKEDPERAAAERAASRRAETGQAGTTGEGTAPTGGPDGSYLSLFLPGSARKTRIIDSMKAFDDFTARKAGPKRKGARR